MPVLEDAAQAAGSRPARAPGRARHRRDVQLLSLEEPRRLRRRRRDHDLRRRIAERARPLRFHGSRDKTTFQLSATTRAWTSSRRLSCACSSRISTAGRTPGAPRRGTTRRRPWRARRAAARRGGRAGVASLCRARIRAPTRSHALAEPPASASAAYYRTPLHRQPPLARYARGSSLPATEEAARTHLAIPMGPVLSARRRPPRSRRAVRAAFERPARRASAADRRERRARAGAPRGRDDAQPAGAVRARVPPPRTHSMKCSHSSRSGSVAAPAASGSRRRAGRSPVSPRPGRSPCRRRSPCARAPCRRTSPSAARRPR